MQLFGLKNCDRCRAALRRLEASGHSVDFVDVRAQSVPTPVLQRAERAFGEALVNRRSTTWRNLSDAERTGDPMRLLAAHPSLMKRPLIIDGDAMTLGWDSKVEARWT